MPEYTGFWFRSSETRDMLALDYPIQPRMRRPEDQPIHSKLFARINEGRKEYDRLLRKCADFKKDLLNIPLEADEGHPCWINGWFPPFDAITLYSYVAARKPHHFVEIGSGVSTTFVRQAILDHRLDTKIISIDPHPNTKIDAICDRTIRTRLEETDLALFDSLTRNDLILCDNSHRSFQGNDVTVFMTEVMPSLLGKGIPVTIHDIFLPYDYPPQWLSRFYNEQYLLIGYVLKGLSIILPNHFCLRDPELSTALDAIMRHDRLRHPSFGRGGGLFWFLT